MAALIRHTVSESKKSLWQNIRFILIVVIGINLLVELTNFLPRKAGSIVSIVILIFVAGLCSYIINRRLAQYTYILIADELIFYKQIGKKENKILNIKIYDINWIKPVDEMPKSKTCKKIYGLACRLKGKGVYGGEFNQDNKTYRFILQPSEELLNELGKQIKKYKNKQSS
ncbi:hypothetical protein [Alkaliphilus crotonatoxidans]